MIEYEYVGGGYFREIGIPKNEKAKILHGMQVLDYIESNIDVVEELDKMTSDQRMSVFANYCKYCGDKNIKCYCMRDE